MARTPQEQRLNGPVRVSMPASVAYDLTALQKGIANLVERLGCPKCFSGADCFFQIERDYIINEKLEVVASPHPEPWAMGPFPEPWRARTAQGVDAMGPQPLPWVTARLDGAVSYDLNKVQSSIAKIVGKLGCEACCSGFDILFRHERDFLVDEAANIRNATLGR